MNVYESMMRFGKPCQGLCHLHVFKFSARHVHVRMQHMMPTDVYGTGAEADLSLGSRYDKLWTLVFEHQKAQLLHLGIQTLEN